MINAPLVLRRDADVRRMKPHADDPKGGLFDAAAVDERCTHERREGPSVTTVSAGHTCNVVIAPQNLTPRNLCSLLYCWS